MGILDTLFPAPRIITAALRPHAKPQPYILNTQAKVNQANAVEGYQRYRLGDHCPFKP